MRKRVSTEKYTKNGPLIEHNSSSIQRVKHHTDASDFSHLQCVCIYFNFNILYCIFFMLFILALYLVCLAGLFTFNFLSDFEYPQKRHDLHDTHPYTHINQHPKNMR